MDEGDATGLLADDGVAEADALAAFADRTTGEGTALDGDVVFAVAAFHWLRGVARVSAQEDAGDELRTSLAWMDLVHQSDPDAVPPGAREQLEQLNDAAPQVSEDNDRAIRQRERFMRTGDVADLDRAVDLLRTAAAGLPDHHPALPAVLTNACFVLTDRHRYSGSSADLDAAIAYGRQAIERTPAGHPFRVERLTALGSALDARHVVTGDAAALDEAVELYRRALAGTGEAHPHRPVSLQNLGTILLGRFEARGVRRDVDEAIDLLRRAVTVTDRGDRLRATAQSNLAGALLERFTSSSDLRDVNEAVELLREAADDPSVGDVDRTLYQSNLAGALQRRFEMTDDMNDLDLAVEAAEKAASGAPPKHLQWPTSMFTLANARFTRFLRLGRYADLDAAVDGVRRARSAVSSEHRLYPRLLTLLSQALAEQFAATREEARIQEAVAVGESALRSIAEGDPNMAMYVSNLASTVMARYHSSGDRRDLDEVVSLRRRALAVTPDAHRDRPRYLFNLSSDLFTRFRHAGERSDLDEAIATAHQAAGAIPPDYAQRGLYISHVGAVLHARFERAGQRADLDEAVKAGRQAVVTSAGRPNAPGCLAKLAQALQTRHAAAGALTDLDEAVTLTRQAVATTPDGHRDRVAYLSNVASLLRLRFDATGRAEGLDEAVDAAEEAARTARGHHADAANCLVTLGVVRRRRYELRGERGDYTAAIEAWRAATRTGVGDFQVAAWACFAWGDLAAGAGEFDVAAEGFRRGVALLPTLAWRGLERTTREDRLAAWSGVTFDAVACAVRAQRTDQAVELLEQGRSVLWAQLPQTRTDLSAVRSADAALADRLTDLRHALDSVPTAATAATAEPGRPTSGEVATDVRMRLAREWEERVAEVRKLPGLAHFLVPTSVDRLREAAGPGPVVAVNASRFGCDALIVSSRGVDVVPLPGLTRQAVQDHTRAFLEALHRADAGPVSAVARDDFRGTVDMVLTWLWDVVAAPVLDHLGYAAPRSSDDARLPRLWWCPTGPLALLPLHAAGRYRDHSGRTECVPDRVVSSYLPNLESLLRARQRSRVQAPQGGIVAVGMPRTPGLSPLPSVTAELDAVASHIPSTTLLVGPAATRDAVVTELRRHSWAHFACHGAQHVTDPASSSLFLHDGRVTVHDLMGEDFTAAELAFLSACQTAAGSLRVPDEAVHIAAAMQFTGYRHVIATLWSISDRHSAEVADAFYRRVSVSGAPDAERAARALHEAVRGLRDRHPDRPELWAPYLHIGP